MEQHLSLTKRKLASMFNDWQNSPAMPHHTPDAVDRPSRLMANRVEAMEMTKKAPERIPHAVNSCMPRIDDQRDG